MGFKEAPWGGSFERSGRRGNGITKGDGGGLIGIMVGGGGGGEKMEGLGCGGIMRKTYIIGHRPFPRAGIR